MKKFPSKLSEPKVVVQWSSTQADGENKLRLIEQVLIKANIRAESLDVSLAPHKKHLQQFKGASQGEYPQLFLYESSIGDFICMASVLEFEANQAEFEECIGGEDEEGKEDTTPGGPNGTAYLEQSFKALDMDDYKQKSVTRLTSAELATFIMSKSLNDLTRNMLKYKVSGQDLKRVTSPAQLMALLHVKKEVANDFFEVLQEEKEKAIAAKSGQAMPETSDGWLRKGMSKWSTRECKGWVSSFIGDAGEQKLVFSAMERQKMNGVLLVRYNRLEELAEQLDLDADDKVQRSMLERVLAAAKIQMTKEFDVDETKEKEELKPFRVRDFRKHSCLRSSKAEDCIMKYTDEDGIARAQMECGHAIASSTVFYYVKQTFANNLAASDIACPVPKCGQKWDWGLICMVADMDEDELAYYNKLRTKRIYSNLCECTNCGKMVFRPKGVMHMKVRCSCSSREFCFQCGHTWRRTDSSVICGNSDCTIVKDLNETLRTQSWTDAECVDQMGNKMPKIRACPRCYTIFIRKEKTCKTVHCGSCKKTFCFRCLTPANDQQKLQCTTGGGHFGLCEIALVQHFG